MSPAPPWVSLAQSSMDQGSVRQREKAYGEGFFGGAFLDAQKILGVQTHGGAG